MSRIDWSFAVVLMLGLGLSGCAEQADTSDEGRGSGPVAPGGSDAAAMAGAPGANTPPGGMAGGGSSAAGASGGAGAMSQPMGGNAGMAGAPAGTSDPRPAGGNAGTGGAAGSGPSAGAGAGGTTDTGGGAGAGDLAGMGSEPPLPMPDYAPSPNNPAECPALAPENPVGDCLGLPIYLTCEYGDDTYWYVCTCDWYHWLCAGT